MRAMYYGFGLLGKLQMDECYTEMLKQHRENEEVLCRYTTKGQIYVNFFLYFQSKLKIFSSHFKRQANFSF
jgi:hypothetical protein